MELSVVDQRDRNLVSGSATTSTAPLVFAMALGFVFLMLADLYGSGSPGRLALARPSGSG